jgi:chorismate dehydratase
MDKIKITAVSYLNTKPLLFGLVQDEAMNKAIDLELNIPSVCAEKLMSGEAQMGLIPVGAIPELQEVFPQMEIVSDFCIGCEGAVKTVCIYSDCPMEEIEELFLDHHSRTSVLLVQILLEEYWKTSPRLLPAAEGFIEQIGGKRAAVVIGDRTIGLERKHAFVYDLGAAWHSYTGLPFVFAAWVSTVKLRTSFLRQFNDALSNGIANIPKLIYLIPSPDPNFDLKEYFSKHISYQLNAKKKEALQLFFAKIKTRQTADLTAGLSSSPHSRSPLI